MEVLLEQKDDSTVILDVTVPRGTVDREINSIAALVRDQAEIKGFRKGTAPIDVIKATYSDTLRAEASARLLQSGIVEALKQHKLKNIGNPVLLEEFRVSEKKKYPGKFKLDGTFNFKVSMLLPPNVEVSNYVGVEVHTHTQEFAKWFSEQIKKQQVLFGQKTLVERPAKVGDQVMADIAGFVNGEPLDAAGSQHENVSFIIGDEEVHQALEMAFVGHAAGQYFSINVDMPEGSQHSVVEFRCLLKEVVEVAPHELNDEFALLLSYESLDALTADYQQKWNTQYHAVRKTQTFAAIMENLIEAHPFEVPTSWVDHELRIVLNRLQMRAQDVVGNSNLLAELRKTAEKTVRSAYLLDKIYEKEPSLHLSAEEVLAEAADIAAQQKVTTTEFLEKLREQGLYEGFITQCEHKSVMNFLIANAIIKEKV